MGCNTSTYEDYKKLKRWERPRCYITYKFFTGKSNPHKKPEKPNKSQRHKRGIHI